MYRAFFFCAEKQNHRNSEESTGISRGKTFVKRVAKVDNFRVEKGRKRTFRWAFLQIVEFLTNWVEKGGYLYYTEGNYGSPQEPVYKGEPALQV